MLHHNKQKNTLLIVFLLLQSVFVFVPYISVQATANHLVISEVQIAGAATTDDFIEIYNPTGQEINLDDYRLVKRTKSGTSDTTLISFSSTEKIPAYGYFLWANDDFTAVSVTPDARTGQTIAADNGIAIREGAEDTGTIIDSVAWGEATNAFVEGAPAVEPSASQSIERKPGAADALSGNGEDTGNNANDFALRTTPEPQNTSMTETPAGAQPANPPGQVSYSDKIWINEILAAPGTTTDWDSDGTADVNDEWVELYNSDTVSHNISGWVLDDLTSGGSSPYTVPSGTIAAGAYLVIYKKDSGLVLNNTGDSVVLKNPAGTIRDQFDYTATTSDKSLARTLDGAGSWATDRTPTMGVTNVLPNQSPTVDAGAAMLTINAGSPYTFAATATDPDGTIAGYAWDFGNGDTGTGQGPSYTFQQAGSYSVRVTVTDDRGGTASDTIALTVQTPNTGGGSSPGTANNSTNNNAVTQPTQPQQFSRLVKLSALLPNPVGADGTQEYIEIRNDDTREINLKDWSIVVGSKKFVLPVLVLEPGERKRYDGGTTKITLTNTAETVQLKDPTQVVVATVSYTNAPEGRAYMLKGTSWEWETLMTPVPASPAPVVAPKVATPQAAVAPKLVAGLPATSVVTPQATSRAPVQAKPIEVLEDVASTTSAYQPVIVASLVGEADAPDAVSSVPVGPQESTAYIATESPAPRPVSTHPAAVIPAMLATLAVVSQYVLGLPLIKTAAGAISTVVGTVQAIPTQHKEIIEQLFQKK